MFQQNGELPALPEPSKRKGNYTGERLKALRPQTYRRVVELLAEPREHVSIREICRQCHVTDDTVKAVEKREAIPIAARKEALMIQAARIAKLASKIKSTARRYRKLLSRRAFLQTSSIFSLEMPRLIFKASTSISSGSMSPHISTS